MRKLFRPKEEEVCIDDEQVVPVVRSKDHAPWSRRVFEWARILLIAGLLALGVRTYVAQTFYVPSGSMIPTLQIGDRILVDRLPFAVHNIHRGDIVVFKRVPADTDPSKPADLVKRVIGLPGETISSKGDTIYINGRSIKEPWLPNFNAQPSYDLCSQTAFSIKPTKIAKNHFFVMGDCRGNSLDSRYWGTVPSSYVVGKVFTVIYRSSHPFLHWF
jgi:signal peptidase I